MENVEKFDINALAKEYGKYFDIKRNKKESDYDYRSRVSGELKRQGYLIEAHEAFSGRRYDDPNQGKFGPMTGLLGAMAKASQGIEFSHGNYENQIGDDLAAGILIKNQRDDNGLANLIDILGPDGTIDVIEAFRGK
jgi:hypothetical protein